MSENFDVSIARCDGYDEENVNRALDEVLELCGGLDFVKPNMNVIIKANLVTAMKPEKSATTHPQLLYALCKRLIDKGANVTVGDSPGGPFTKVYLNQVYKTTGLTKLLELGVKLNDNFEEIEVSNPEGLKCKEFPMTAYLKEADVIINFCKLKSHGMMALSCAVKNLFGIIPGTIKPEFHFRYPNYTDFANMLIDLNVYLKPQLCIVDAISAMEGNGPTAGTPKHVGLILASKNQYKLDYVCADIIGLSMENVPTIEESYKRGFIPKNVEDIKCNLKLNDIKVLDFDTRKTHKTLWFEDDTKLIGKVAKKLFSSKPNVEKTECVGCEKCKNVCPVGAITMKDKIPTIDRKKCIKCFCCQEFCPKGAMKVKRTALAKMIEKGR